MAEKKKSEKPGKGVPTTLPKKKVVNSIQDIRDIRQGMQDHMGMGNHEMEMEMEMPDESAMKSKQNDAINKIKRDRLLEKIKKDPELLDLLTGTDALGEPSSENQE